MRRDVYIEGVLATNEAAGCASRCCSCRLLARCGSLLNQSLSPGHLLLGAALALGGTAAFASLQPPEARLRRPAAIAQLLWLVFADIVRSNIAVARIVLGWGARNRTAGFLVDPARAASSRRPGGARLHRHRDARHGLGRL